MKIIQEHSGDLIEIDDARYQPIIFNMEGMNLTVCIRDNEFEIGVIEENQTEKWYRVKKEGKGIVLESQGQRIPSFDELEKRLDRLEGKAKRIFKRINE